MLLRASGELSGNAVDVHAVTSDDAAVGSGIAHAPELLAFAEAIVAREPEALAAARTNAREAVGAAGLVDAAAVASNFERMVRIADSTGIPLDTPVAVMSADLREELDLNTFGGAENTPAPGPLGRALAIAARPVSKLALRVLSRIMRRRFRATRAS